MMANHKLQVKEYYAKLANRYDALITRHRGLEELKRIIMKTAEVREGITVLDVGTGTGYYAIDFAKAIGKHGELVGIDIAPGMVKKARENALKSSLSKPLFLAADGENIPFKSQLFDLVLCVNTLRYMSNPARFMTGIIQILKPEGKIILADGDLSIITKKSDPSRVRQILQKHGLEYFNFLRIRREGLSHLLTHDGLVKFLRNAGMKRVSSQLFRIFFIIKASKPRHAREF